MGIFGFGRGLVFDGGRSGFFLEVVDEFDEKEDGEGDDEEIDDGLEEVAVVYGGRFFDAEEGRTDKFKAGEVETADNHGDDGHDDVVYKGSDDGGESATDDDADGEVDNGATVNELFELFEDFGFFFLDFFGEFGFFGGELGSFGF